jgi:hypothetical protein
MHVVILDLSSLPCQNTRDEAFSKAEWPRRDVDV